MKRISLLLSLFAVVFCNAQTFRISITDSLKQSALDGSAAVAVVEEQ